MTDDQIVGTVGERISDAREAKGFSSLDLAERLGVKSESVENWESNTSSPRANRLAMLAGVLDVSLFWLLDGSLDHEPGSIRSNRVDVVAQKLEQIVRMQEDLGKLVNEITEEVAEIQRIDAELEELAA